MQNIVPVNDQLSRRDLFEAFRQQLAKDFEQSNFEANFVQDLEPDYSHIREKIAHELQRSEKRADADLLRLLYRIDISEFQLKQYLNENRNQNHLNTIAELMIKRVLQKVVTRHFYKNK